MTIVFVGATIGVYAVVTKYVLNNISKPHPAQK